MDTLVSCEVSAVVVAIAIGRCSWSLRANSHSNVVVVAVTVAGQQIESEIGLVCQWSYGLANQRPLVVH